jgi:hypothetical protein
MKPYDNFSDDNNIALVGCSHLISENYGLMGSCQYPNNRSWDKKKSSPNVSGQNTYFSYNIPLEI